ncbi:hypothetical protein IVB03_32555 [Bradyrhizobium sp. 168]|uniref:hypothetical protein n=1 Tax=unclassified Bradyrhizobium TaxID=2631580 RepID=UPI001FFAB447|nr:MULTISPECIES: hypothetical protein [unclassified Bradyrhizobium]MCK1584154.1 hypothetical protein [Bradyrhizobium sp. 168]UPK13017.1 hypothetical protein IVA93_07415 [Bradyrhizobium sp. 155]UPK18094.1 hypothetical protein IVA73_29100 [Bradyrhizobium sp. 131]
MTKAKDAVVWTNSSTHEVRVAAKGEHRPDTRGGAWGDPIGASYLQWQEMNDSQRVHLMLETAIDLATQGFDLSAVLREFSEVEEFRALGSNSYPMCRALTKALIGRSLEPNDMTFEELLEAYRPELGQGQ